MLELNFRSNRYSIFKMRYEWKQVTLNILLIASDDSHRIVKLQPFDGKSKILEKRKHNSFILYIYIYIRSQIGRKILKALWNNCYWSFKNWYVSVYAHKNRLKLFYFNLFISSIYTPLLKIERQRQISSNRISIDKKGQSKRNLIGYVNAYILLFRFFLPLL